MTTPEPPGPVCAAAGCTHPPTAGSVLCAVDRQNLGDWIAQIGDEYDRLDATPSLQAPAAGSTSGGGLKSHRSVGDLDVMVLRDRRSRERSQFDPDGNSGLGVLEVLSSWAETVRAERGLLGPTRQAVAALEGGPVCAAYARFRDVRDFLPRCGHESCQGLVRVVDVPAYPTVRSERKLLSDEFDWIVRQDWAGELFDQVRAVWDLLRAANGDARAPRLRCPDCGKPARWSAKAVVCGSCKTSTSGLAIVRRHSAGTAA